MPLQYCGQLSAADLPHIARTVPDINRQAVNNADFALLLDWKPVFGMLKSGKQVIAWAQMGRVLGKQLWGLARNHLNKVPKAEGLAWSLISDSFTCTNTNLLSKQMCMQA